MSSGGNRALEMPWEEPILSEKEGDDSRRHTEGAPEREIKCLRTSQYRE
jgi:hypothetical protein